MAIAGNALRCADISRLCDVRGTRRVTHPQIGRAQGSAPRRGRVIVPSERLGRQESRLKGTSLVIGCLLVGVLIILLFVLVPF